MIMTILIRHQPEIHHTKLVPLTGPPVSSLVRSDGNICGQKQRWRFDSEFARFCLSSASSSRIILSVKHYPPFVARNSSSRRLRLLVALLEVLKELRAKIYSRITSSYLRSISGSWKDARCSATRQGLFHVPSANRPEE